MKAGKPTRCKPGCRCGSSRHKLERRKWRPAWFRQVVDLLGARPELRGVSKTADVIDEAVRWSA